MLFPRNYDMSNHSRRFSHNCVFGDWRGNVWKFTELREALFRDFPGKKLLRSDVLRFDLRHWTQDAECRRSIRRLAEVPDDTSIYTVFICTVCECPRHNMARKCDKRCRWQHETRTYRCERPLMRCYFERIFISRHMFLLSLLTLRTISS